jgi:hypothetical protein
MNMCSCIEPSTSRLGDSAFGRGVTLGTFELSFRQTDATMRLTQKKPSHMCNIPNLDLPYSRQITRDQEKHDVTYG